MAWIQKGIVIDAPADDVFATLVDPEKASVLNRDFLVKTYRMSSLGAPELDFDYRIAGFIVSAKTTVKECLPPTRLVAETKGGFESCWEWSLEADRRRTSVVLSVDYTLPGGLFGMILGRLALDRYHDQALEDLLRNLKSISERGTPFAS